MSGDVSQFKTVAAWQAALGLLPVPLRDTEEKQCQYVLMNGSTGNFCLDFIGGLDSTSQRATAWSCDVGHYITCAGDFVVVNRWGKEAPEERYSCQSVFSRLHDFHLHLEKTSPDRSRSIVTHVLRVFRRIRAVVNEENSGVSSLRILLHLLASAASGRERLSGSDLIQWGLTPEIVEPSQTISAATWQPLYNDLSGTGRYDVLRPDFQLLLRHASGAVFQDAHLEVNNSPTLWLPGLELPATVAAKAVPSDTGIYFTPAALARTLAEEATKDIHSGSNGPLLLFDPACGSGELLKECLRQLQLKSHIGPVRVIGWDRSPVAVDMARFVLAWEKRAWRADQIEVDIAQHDSLTAERWPPGVDILLMNPPFKSWVLMDLEEQALVSRLLGSSNRPNLAMAFARRALDVLSETGTLAMVTPNSLLEASSGRHVREKLAEILTPQLIARLGDQSYFARALVDAGLYVGKRRPTIATAILWADSRPTSVNHALRGLRKWRGAQSEPIGDNGFSVYTREDIGRDGSPWVARQYEAWRSYESIRGNKRMVPAKRIFEILQGVRLGNDAFIVSKDYFQDLPDTERPFFRPASMNPSVEEGRLLERYYVFYPYTGGLPSLSTEDELQTSVPKYFQDRLAPAKPKLLRRKSIAREGLNWWDLERPRTWQQGLTPKIISKYFGGKRSFAFDDTGEFVVVVGNAWLLQRGAMTLPITEMEVYSATLAYLSSGLADVLLRYVSVQVSGGQLDLSHKYVGNLPIPNLAKLEPAEVSRLVEMGVAISEGRIEDWAEVDESVLSILISES